MTEKEYDKASKLDQILYDETGMLVKNHKDIKEAMQKYAEWFYNNKLSERKHPENQQPKPDNEQLDIAGVSGSAWNLPSGIYQVGVDRAAPNSSDYSCRIWMKKGISGQMLIVAEEHYR